MQVKLRKTLNSQWYRQLIMAVLVGLLMASLAHAETKPDDTLYDEWPELVGKWGPMMKLRDNSNEWAERKPKGGWWVGPIHTTLLPSGKIIVTGFSRREEKRCRVGDDQLHTAGENGISFVLDPENMQEKNGNVYLTSDSLCKIGPLLTRDPPVDLMGAGLSDTRAPCCLPPSTRLHGGLRPVRPADADWNATTPGC